MSPHFIRLRTEQTVGEALEALRTQELEARILYLYVVNDDDVLEGVIPVRRLLTADPATSLSDLIVTDVISVRDTATVLEACELFLHHRLLALPALDEQGRLRGVVDVTLFTNEISELAHKEELDHVFQLIGVHAALGRKVSPWTSFRDRFPWLLCNMASGLICALITSRFELLISEVTALALFITVVLALAESVSMQSMTLTLEALHHGAKGVGRMFGAARRELLAALFLGGASGVVVFAAAAAWRGQPGVAGVVGASIFCSMAAACLLGVLVPSTIRLLHADPRVASGPIVLAGTDVATLLLYFGTASWLLS
jgi:magnesium transporter